MNLFSVFRKQVAKPQEPVMIHDALFEDSATPEDNTSPADKVFSLVPPPAVSSEPAAEQDLVAAPAGSQDEEEAQQRATTRPPAGMMAEPEIEAFFAKGYFGSGRYHGAKYGTRNAMDLGKQELIADFALVLSAMVERRLSKRDRVQSEILRMEGFSDALTARLRLTIEHLDRQVAVLEDQALLAEQGQGWVQAALNKYHLGFDRGVTDAVDFELLVA